MASDFAFDAPFKSRWSQSLKSLGFSSTVFASPSWIFPFHTGRPAPTWQLSAVHHSHALPLRGTKRTKCFPPFFAQTKKLGNVCPIREEWNTLLFYLCWGGCEDKDARLHHGEARQKPSWSIIIIPSSPDGLACQNTEPRNPWSSHCNQIALNSLWLATASLFICGHPPAADEERLRKTNEKVNGYFHLCVCLVFNACESHL